MAGAAVLWFCGANIRRANPVISVDLVIVDFNLRVELRAAKGAKGGSKEQKNKP